jgi:hypothetical protein
MAQSEYTIRPQQDRSSSEICVSLRKSRFEQTERR